MNCAELLDDGPLCVPMSGRRREPEPFTPFIPFADDSDSVSPIDKLEHKGASQRVGPEKSASRSQAAVQRVRNVGPAVYILIGVARNVLPAICAALSLVALYVLGEASTRETWEIAIPAGLAAVGCAFLLMAVLKFKSHLKRLEKKQNC